MFIVVQEVNIDVAGTLSFSVGTSTNFYSCPRG